jgi:hypothetical protein
VQQEARPDANDQATAVLEYLCAPMESILPAELATKTEAHRFYTPAVLCEGRAIEESELKETAGMCTRPRSLHLPPFWVHTLSPEAGIGVDCSDMDAETEQEQGTPAKLLSATDFPSLFAKEFEKYTQRQTKEGASTEESEAAQVCELEAEELDRTLPEDAASKEACSDLPSELSNPDECGMQYLWMTYAEGMSWWVSSEESESLQRMWSDPCSGWSDGPFPNWMDGVPPQSTSHANVPKYTDFSVCHDENREATTFMIHNVPNDYTRTVLIDVLDGSGLYGKIDFLHLPIDRSTKQNVGYAFINFIDVEAAQEGVQILSNFEMCRMRRRSSSVKVRHQKVWLSPAYLQGLEENLEHYRNTSSKPLVRINGRWSDELPCMEVP